MNVEPTPGAPTAAAPSASASGRARPLLTATSMLVPLAWVLAISLLVLGAAALLLHTLVQREAGARWVLQQLPGVTVEGWQGALLGDHWRADRVRIEWDEGRAHAVLEKVDAGTLSWRWRPSPQAWLGLRIDQLQVNKIVVDTGPPGPRPIPLPASIALPLEFELSRARVESLQIDQFPVATGLSLERLVLDPRPSGEHSLDQLAATVAGVQAALSARVGTQDPMPLVVQGRVAPAPGSSLPPWTAEITLGGNARETSLAATLQGPASAGRPAPAAELRAALQLLQAWPLESLALSTRDLDLADIQPKAPRTRLTGQAELRMSARDAPAFGRIALSNAAPGRWNDRRLPVARLTADLTGTLAQPDRLELVRAEALLADASRPAGRVQLKALWQGPVLELQGRLDGVTPGRIDPRAPAMTLAGPLELRLAGLPSPDPTAPKATAAAAMSLRWLLDLTGQLEASPQPVRLTMAGEADERKLDITRMRASAGAAQADAKLLLARSGPGAADWKLSTTGSVVDFDPLPWWPGNADSPWRRGPHRLAGGWEFDGRLPADSATIPPLQLLQRLAGNGRLRLQDSQVAGVPLSADITLGYTQAAAPSTALLRADLRLGGNQLRIEGRADPAGDGRADRWNADLQADALAGLAPLFALHPSAAAWTPRRGRFNLNLGAEGRWPALRTAGLAQLSQLQLGGLELAHGRAQWQFDARGERSLNSQVDLGGLVWRSGAAVQRADHVRASVSGSLASHRIDVSGAAPLTPPPLLLKLFAARAETGTRAQLVARGSWQAQSDGSGRWQARVERVLLGAWDGSDADGAPTSSWVQANELDASLDFGPGFDLKAVRAGAGRILLSDVLALRWEGMELKLGATRNDLQLRADIEPFRLAPLLKRVQPGIDWKGDLRLAARVALQAGERLEADFLFERRDGDLHIDSAEGLLLLGLTDVRLGLTAREGKWTLTPLFRGRSLGEVSGTAVVQTTPQSRRPPDDSPLSGNLTARVADIGIWGPWVPAGWRLAGELSTQASLSGTLGQPRLTGEMSGKKIAVRNLLQGINVSDGTLAIKLDGERARIEQLSLKGGDGILKVTGDAELGAQARARLEFEAQKFRVISRADRNAVASGTAQLLLTRERGQLDGRIKLDEGLFDASRSDAPSLDEDVTVQGPDSPQDRASDEPARRRNFVLGLELDLGERLRVKGRGLDTGLRGDLKLSAPGGRLAINGSIRTDQGTYAAYGQKLEIERGIVTFTGPPGEPRLDILALRPNIDVRVGVAITGTTVTPRVRLYSEPDSMGETEKLSWLVLGRAPDGLGRNDTALLQRAAVALLSGEGEAPTDQLLSRLGIDDVSLRQGDTDVRETVVSLGKQLSRRWYLGYERGVNATTGTWQLTYRIAQRFTLRAQSGLENSLDVIWTWRLQETPSDASMRKSTIELR